MKLTAGAKLHNEEYLVNHVLKQSSGSVTLQATQLSSNHSVVIKTLPPALQETPQFAPIKQQFVEQMRRFEQCRHPGLVRLLTSFESAGLPFAVMDYTPGQTLAELVQTGGPLPEELAVRYIQQVASALTVLHQHGLIHQAVIPQNIVRPPGSDVVILVNCEFQLASSDPEGSLKPATTDFSAIEQYQLQTPLTPATDVYALAGTLYYLLTRHTPLPAPQRGHQSLPSPRQFRPQLSSTLENALLKGLALNPKNRPMAIGEWVSLLIPTTTMDSSVSNGIHSPALPELAKTSGSQAKQVSSTPQAAIPATSTPAPTPIKTGSPQPASSNVKSHSSMTSLSSSRFSKALITTVMAAIALGAGAGLTLRLAASSTGPGASFFHSEQSFPPIGNWPSSATPVEPTASYTPSTPVRMKSEPTPFDPNSIHSAPRPLPKTSIAPDPAPPEPIPETVQSPDVAPAPEATSPPSVINPEPITPIPAPAAPAVIPEPPPPPAIPAPAKQDAPPPSI